MYPQTECISKVWYIYTIDFPSCERIFMPFTGKVMQWAMLKEFNQPQTNTTFTPICSIILFIHITSCIKYIY